MTAPDAGDPTPSDPIPSLARAVAALSTRVAEVRDPLDRVRAYTSLLAALGYELKLISGERDAALAELLATGEHPSHRALSAELGLTRQRVDQLAAHARAGSRSRR